MAELFAHHGRPLLLSIVLSLLLILFVSGCDDETDPQLIAPVGVTILFIIDSGQAYQNLTDVDPPVQISEWTVNSACFEYAGLRVELLYGQADCPPPPNACLFTRSPSLGTVDPIECTEAITISGEQTATATLDMILDVQPMTYRVGRGEPAPQLSVEGDVDNDGIPDLGYDTTCRGGVFENCNDNCPYAQNENQADIDGDGQGDVCTTPLGVLDSDGDGIRDNPIQIFERPCSVDPADLDPPDLDTCFDNCIWKPNTDQFDSGWPTGIGDACAQQADVVLSRPDFRGELADFTPPAFGTILMVVDFNNTVTMTCNWDGTPCTLDMDAVKLCNDPSGCFLTGP